MFYVSSVFMEVLNQFHETGEDVAGKQRYAAWRAGELSKAAKEGRPPPPPPDTSEAEAGIHGGDVSTSRTRALVYVSVPADITVIDGLKTRLRRGLQKKVLKYGDREYVCSPLLFPFFYGVTRLESVPLHSAAT